MGDKGGGGSSPPPIFYNDPRTEIDAQLGAQLEQMTLLTKTMMDQLQNQSTPPPVPDPDTNIDPDLDDLPPYRPDDIEWSEKIGEFKTGAEEEVYEMIEKIRERDTLVTSPLIGEEEPDIIKTLLGGY